MENAELYVSSNGLQRRDALMVLRGALPAMNWEPEGEKILDIGCGSGDVTRNLLLPLLPTVDQVVGVDVSHDMVTFASKNFEHNSLSFKQLDIARIIQPRQIFPEGFTKIFSFYCLHWIPDQEQCLTNVLQLLQPGGEALLVFLAQHPLFTMYERMAEKPRWAEYMKDVSNFVPRYQYKADPAADFANTATEIGFEVLECKAPQLFYVFENINYLINAIKAVNPFLPRIPKNDHDAFVKDCLQVLADMNTPQQDGRTFAHYNLMVAHLTRPE
ncbi:juvenile hormone acid methyltransferase [Oratosquilla oratoria]|uniref:juvenile hormone acid methyltransferase n=1 Tax=Oratosquilla oratoria TaxID=337810 RepID=UPI003F75ABFC